MFKNLAHVGRMMAVDLASTILFLVLYAWLHNIPLAVGCGMALGLAQIAWQLARKIKIDSMQWLSLFLVLGSGAATLLTNDARFIMIKPSAIYVIVGIVMLRPGWMSRYLPAVAQEIVGDMATAFGFVWAALMFASAGLNYYVAMHYDPVTWSAFMAAWALVSKLALVAVQIASMRIIGMRRRKRMAASNAVPAAQNAV